MKSVPRCKNGLFLFSIVIFLLPLCAFAKYSGGDGSAGDPFQIATPNDLNDIGDDPCDWDKHFILIADINMADYLYRTALIAPDLDSSNDTFDGIRFTGFFDGNNHIISNLTIDTNGVGEDYLGLFGHIWYGLIEDMGIVDVNITSGDGSQNIGGLAGACYRGDVNDCYSTGTITVGDNSMYIGGLVGSVGYRQVENCYSTVSINAGDEAIAIGGLLGFTQFAIEVTKCFSTGSITTGNYPTDIGGFAGSCGYSSKIVNCYSKGSVSAGNDGWSWAGVGGLVGAQSYRSSDIFNCYSACTVAVGQGTIVGGLVGNNWGGGIIQASFWDSDLNPDVNGIGNGSDPNVVGIPTKEMQQQATFDGWDFVEVWGIGEGQTYPYLREYAGYDLDHNKRTDANDLAIMIENWLKEGL